LEFAAWQDRNGKSVYRLQTSPSEETRRNNTYHMFTETYLKKLGLSIEEQKKILNLQKERESKGRMKRKVREFDDDDNDDDDDDDNKYTDSNVKARTREREYNTTGLNGDYWNQKKLPGKRISRPSFKKRKQTEDV
jgi:hypothetical protein